MINDALLRALGWTLAHTLWQASLVALLLLIFLPRMKKAQQRYWAAYAALLLVFASAITTFFWVYEPLRYQAAPIAGAVAAHTEHVVMHVEAQTVSTSIWQSFSAWLETNHALIVAVWLLGFGFFLLRLGAGLWQVQRLRTRGLAALESGWLENFERLRQRLGYRRVVALFESALVQTPMAIGWLKPVVLLPIGLINRLSVAEVEAVLAHELAHIARRDWIFNLLQAFIESLFYHHPAVWWMSNVVRRERENCCDDAALAATGNPLAFAKALVQVQEMATPAPVLALALSGSNRRHPLLDRVRRILNQPQQRQQQVMEKITATVILLALLALVGLKANSVPAIEAAFSQISDIPMTLFGSHRDNSQIAGDSLPKPKSTRKITREEDNERVEAEFQDGKLKRLNINGKEIPESEFGAHKDLADELREETTQPPSGFWHGAPEPPEAPEAPEAMEAPELPETPEAPMMVYPMGSRSAIRVISDKDAAGNTLIRLDNNNGEATEVVVKNNEVYVNGKMLAKGESLDIPGLNVADGSYAFYMDGHEFNFEGDEASAENASNYSFSSESQREDMERAMEERQQAYAESQRAYQRDLKRAQQEMKENNKDWAKEQKRFQKEQEKWAKEQQQWAIEQEKWAAEQQEWQRNAQALQETLKSELLKDGLISNGDKFSLELDETVLKVNNKKQSEAMHKKYLELINKMNGDNIKGKNRFLYNFSDDDK